MNASNPIKAKLWPLVKRHGLLLGLSYWFDCNGGSGHSWVCVGELYLIKRYERRLGTLHEAKGKAVCRKCGSAKLIDLYVVRWNDGTVKITSPSGQVNLID